MTDLFEKSIHTLELPRVLEKLAEQAVTEEGKERCMALRPLTDADDVQRLQAETTAAVNMTALRGSPSLSGVKPVAASLQRADMGGALNTRELLDIAAVLRAARSARDYAAGENNGKTCIDHLFASLTANRFLEDKITGSILGENEIADSASPELASIRRHIRATSAKVRVVNSIQAMGDFSATTSGGMDRLPTDDELNGGIIGYGVSNIISSFFGCPPTATYSQNVGIVGSTRVISRKVFSVAAVILLIAGLIPKFSALLRTIPQCVLGGAVASVFASIAMTGIKLLVTEKLTYRNTTVAGLAIAIGMGVSLSDGCLNQMSASIHSALNMSMSLESFQSIINNTFASSPVVLATIFAVILNLILPKDKPDAQ